MGGCGGPIPHGGLWACGGPMGGCARTQLLVAIAFLHGFFLFTVDFRAIEIDLQEAISRFLNVPGNRADSQSISKRAREIQRCQY